jgi:hypothetical protein
MPGFDQQSLAPLKPVSAADEGYQPAQHISTVGADSSAEPLHG